MIKNYLIIFLIFIAIGSKISHAENCKYNSKKLIASAFYRDSDSNITTSLGDIFIENSKIIFRKEDVIGIEKNIPLNGTEKKSDFNKIISGHKKKYKIESSIRDKFTKILNDEVNTINKNKGFYPSIYSSILNIETKETSLIKLKTEFIGICDKHFLETLILRSYSTYGILILPRFEPNK